MDIKPIIGKTWFSGDTRTRTILMAIPKKISSMYNLQEPTNILLIPQENGILIKRLVIE
jgi:hypothetical protein